MKNELTTFVFRVEDMDEYKRGFISGIMYYLGGKPETTFRWIRMDDADDGIIWVKDLECTEDQAWEIRNEIEKHYPGIILEMA
jgi:hypothetical protein